MNRQREVNEYLDGRLNPKRRKAFEAAMNTDPALAARVEEGRRVMSLLQALPTDDLPRDLTGGIMTRVRGERIPAPRRVTIPVRTWLQPQRLAVAFAALLIAVGAGVLTQPEQVELSAGDEAFISECLRDYHFEASLQLAETADAAQAEAASHAPLEF